VNNLYIPNLDNDETLGTVYKTRKVIVYFSLYIYNINTYWKYSNLIYIRKKRGGYYAPFWFTVVVLVIVGCIQGLI